ncbi:hypothetical protein ASPVEDRAFT_891813 [Aspergillus versicolor CBS 583.65]|uniref:Uncharacterized protein n=1 Tax=Aspergillus versicolor CBS 583.65 TaxID=1036611 RepID=A0A1L9PS74_ASPVE|nr:uncharacterized protein ASPVEDRAFT_891813 [Aspergillus versicolor CBS 583.65]OJJ04341.1 hypothetical protein ASPVEDRAFT_891813 [Aspergillus versicolor CBS 583.65]
MGIIPQSWGDSPGQHFATQRISRRTKEVGKHSQKTPSPQKKKQTVSVVVPPRVQEPAEEPASSSICKSIFPALLDMEADRIGLIESASGLAAILLSPVIRDPDWLLDHKGRPVVKDPRTPHQEGGYALHLRGEALSDSEACTHCQTGRAFISYIVGPEYRRSAVWSGSCSNYVWAGSGAKCSVQAT